MVEYVAYLHHKTAVHVNASASTVPPSLSNNIPLLGPYFFPPTYLHIARQNPTPIIDPETVYLVALTVIHPFFYPGLLTTCPQCASTEILWDGWNATGGRDVLGVQRNERAIGFQLRCKNCKSKYGKGGSELGPQAPGYCFATTNQCFWQNWEHRRIPR